jgi:hypothetical protein
MKIVVNRSKGSGCGYKLSSEACDMLGVVEPYSFYAYEDRTLQKLIDTIEFLQERANGEGADLRVLSVPDDLETKDELGRTVRNWHLSERDGYEVIRENHRYW